MKRFPILRGDLLHWKKVGRAFFFAVLVGILCMMCIYDWYYYVLEGQQDAVVAFIFGNTVIGWFFPIEMSVAAAYPVYMYCSEWKNGFWKPVVERVGKKCYLQEKPVACFLQGMLIYFVGKLLEILILVVTAKISGAPIVSKGIGLCPWEEHPIFYMILASFSISMAAGFWSSLAFLLASWQMDLFIAIIIPLTGYVCLTYLLPWDLVNIAALKAFPDSVWMSFGYSILLFGILSLGCIVLSRRLLARRMENEHVA